MTQSHITTLQVFTNKNIDTPIKALTVTQIKQYLNYSRTKIYTIINLLCSQKLLSEGYKHQNATTYYITQQGKQYINKLLD